MKNKTAPDKNATSNPAVVSTDWFGGRPRVLLAQLTADQRASAYAQLNTWKWPEALAELKPSRWDTLSHAEISASEEMKDVWRALHEMTSEFDRSRAWWLDQLGRTADDHLEWWLAQRRPPNGELTRGANHD